MTGYVLRRLLGLVPVLLFVSFVTFGLVRLAPGDPVLIVLGGKKVDPATMERIARATDGRSFAATSGDELEAVYEQIRRSVGYETETRDITRWWLAGGLVVLLLAGAAGVVWMQRIP